MVALPFGPEIGIARSASPEAPFTFVDPDGTKPSRIGVPSAVTTRSSFWARESAVLYASDDFRTLKTKKKMQTTKMTPSTMNVKQPVGTNHFQFRDHQPPRGGCGVNGGGVEGTGGGGGSMRSL